MRVRRLVLVRHKYQRARCGHRADHNRRPIWFPRPLLLLLPLELSRPLQLFLPMLLLPGPVLGRLPLAPGAKISSGGLQR